MEARTRKGVVVIEVLASMIIMLILFSGLRYFSEKKFFTPKRLLTTTALDALSVDVLRREGTAEAYQNGLYSVLGQKAKVTKTYTANGVVVEITCNGFTKVYYGNKP